MSKVFRLYTGGTDTYRDWNSAVSFPYDAQARKTISDPIGASARHEITSIPSPFARIDLVKSAFREVADSKRLDGDTIFHKMVSDTLDVGELFFNLNKLSDKLEVITWTPRQRIDELLASADDGHRYYGDALRKFMESDAPYYHFDQVENIYLLNYKHGPSTLNIIGATSPATLFFSTANSLDYVDDIFFAHDKPFDGDYQPLYARADKEYIKSWFILRNTIPGFASLFPEVDDYLELTYQQLADNDLKQQLRTIDSHAPGFEPISIHANGMVNRVEVLGHQLYRKGAVRIKSGFEMVTSRSEGRQMPLVLPVEAGNHYAQVPYTTGPWGNVNKAPYVRTPGEGLPFDGEKMDWLTISDLLEDYIVKVPHTLNKEMFFDGHCKLEGISKCAYLLPLKRVFFDYFTARELVEGLPTGERMIEMSLLAGESVKVTLRIPIVGDGRDVHFVEYSRIYYGANNKADIAANRGSIKTFDFAGFVMPNVRFNNPREAFYTIGCVTRRPRTYTLDFYNAAGRVEHVTCDCRSQHVADGIFMADTYTVEHQNFDYIQLTDRFGSTAIMVPRLRPQVSNERFTFAVDLGTSNTHIEYTKYTNGPATPPRVFSYSKEQGLLGKMFVPSMIDGQQAIDDLRIEEEFMEKDYLPAAVGGDAADFCFPTRTVLSHSKDINWSNTLQPFALVNPSLTYLKRLDLPHNTLATDLKWGTGDSLRMTEAYIDNLMLMMRNKVLMENGQLADTEIRWFYPISMAPRRLNVLRHTWDNAYRKYFGQGGTVAMTESEAPIKYYFHHHAEATRLVNVDIGGGTTDIAYSDEKDIKFVTSFKFAANALFANAIAKDDRTNGIIDHYTNVYRTLFNDNLRTLGELPSIFQRLQDNPDPANMATFLFSLSSNAYAQRLNRNETDFNARLCEDANFKVVFIIFYAAIIYHIAQIVRQKGLREPRHITFSGNGSKVLNIITTNREDLARLTKKIFEHVLRRPYDGELDILGLEPGANPKTNTCKGGLMSDNRQAADRDQIVIMRADGTDTVHDTDTYEQVDDAYIRQAAKAVGDFFSFVLGDLNRQVNFDDYFGVTNESMNAAREVSAKDIETFLKKGLGLMIDEADVKDRIGETLFFFPVKGVMQALSRRINQNL